MAKSESTAEPVMLILAAGLATRLGGRPKSDLEWVNGQPLLAWHSDWLARAGFIPWAVVRPDTQYRPAHWVENPAPQIGIAQSLKVGLQAVRGACGSRDVGVILVDQPFVGPYETGQVYAAFCQRPRTIHALRARYHGVPGHPVFFDTAFDAVVAELAGDRGLGAVWEERHDTAWYDLEVRSSAPPTFDIDTEAAYQTALTWLSKEVRHGL